MGGFKEETFVAMLSVVCWGGGGGRRHVSIIYVCGWCQGCFIFILWICRALYNPVFRIGFPIKTEDDRQTWRTFVPVNL